MLLDYFCTELLACIRLTNKTDGQVTLARKLALGAAACSRPRGNVTTQSFLWFAGASASGTGCSHDLDQQPANMNHWSCAAFTVLC